MIYDNDVDCQYSEMALLKGAWYLPVLFVWSLPDSQYCGGTRTCHYSVYYSQGITARMWSVLEETVCSASLSDFHTNMDSSTNEMKRNPGFESATIIIPTPENCLHFIGKRIRVVGR